MTDRKLRVGILYGGRSGEHEVSLSSARTVLDALDPARYEPVLLGIDQRGRWHLEQERRAPGTQGAPLTIHPDSPLVTLVPGAAGQLSPIPNVATDPSEPKASPARSESDVPRGSGAPPRGSGRGGREGGFDQIDAVFPVLHGTYGEDGTVQGLLEMAGVPYVGSGVLGSALAMDKEVTKRLLREAGLPVVEHMVIRAARRGRPTDLVAQVGRLIGFPCFVKPANLGSSVGVHKVRTPRELHAAVDDALRFDTKALVERAVDARELECSVLGNDDPEASVPGEIMPHADFYTYEAKYVDAGGATLAIPADLSADQVRRVQELSVRAFTALELSGMARVDFLMERSSGRLLINELNTIPGFTAISMYPKLWEASGLPLPKLVDRLLELALERHRARAALTTRYEPTRDA